MNNNPICIVVEDDPDLSIIFSEALTAAGFETQIIRDGQEAMDWLAESVPYLVILDMHLPQVAGTTILNFIRAEERLSNVLVVVVTADAITAEQVRDQADFVMVKPVSFRQLQDLTERLKPK